MEKMNNTSDQIRNFCIIAHVDHGKSTLADRMLELTGSVEKREMKEQLLDQLDLERERGITIKLAPARMRWQSSKNTSKEYELNLIDTPGHVDFAYEVSRSLAAVEGAVLLVDASQGIEAQTLSTLYAALEHDLVIIPVVNKIDLPAARPDEVAEEISSLLGCERSEVIFASGKTGEGVSEILDAIVERIPSPQGNPDGATRALIFDSVYDSYRGVVSYVRVMEGKIEKNDSFFLMETKSEGEALEVGYFSPKLIAQTPLLAGEIGYIVTGFKDVSEARVGDTITLKANPAPEPLPGYKQVLPLVFSSIFCTDGADYPELKEAIEKLKLNDASLSYEAERSEALGFGFRCGFLGLLHMDIVKERLEREYDLSLVISSPTVQYKVINFNDEEKTISRPSDFPVAGSYREIHEPIAKVEFFTPKEYVGSIMEVAQRKRAIYKTVEYLDESRAILHYDIPLAEVIIDLYDSIKSVSKGYASMNYEVSSYAQAELERVEIMISGEKVDALSFITEKSKVYNEGKRIVEKLRELIPRQNFEIRLQATVGAKIVASERISPFRKDVISKLYGGDVTRKNKLLEKQKKGKKKMKQIGRVEVPSDVFIKVLRTD
ncbi:MAG: Elongation factor 4 [bacterium ADurb.Bin400]|nr:MAG: Elongation factor 4 [bacterium ADurb.Bin400]